MGGPNNAVSSITAYFVQGAASSSINGIAPKKPSEPAKDNFDDIFSKVSDSVAGSKTTDTSRNIKDSLNESKSTVSGSETKTQAVTDNTTAQEETVETVKEDAQTQEVQAIAKEVEEAPVDEELANAINEDAQELISQIAEAFDVSEEDIVNAMQVLGLMAADLLNPENLSQLVTQVTGQEGAIDLITDSDIYTSLQDLMEGAESMKSELMNEFNLSEEELQAAIEDAPKSFKEQLEGMEQNIETEIPVQNNVSENIPATKQAPGSEEVSESAHTMENKEPVVEITTQKSGTGQDGNKGNLQSGAESSNLFNQVMNNITEAAANVESTSTVSYTDRTQMEDIIRQITEKITISAGTDETSMEMQLHPASLGNVNILLTSSKDGIVAKFTAQNEIVREAVESQMVQLQQKFDEQGIKVTSIEVTIAAHGFEQNLEQGNDRGSGEANEGKKTKPLRRINLSDLTDEDLSEPENEAEKIAVQMMEANGNSVDFSA